MRKFLVAAVLAVSGAFTLALAAGIDQLLVLLDADRRERPIDHLGDWPSTLDEWDTYEASHVYDHGGEA